MAVSSNEDGELASALPPKSCEYRRPSITGSKFECPDSPTLGSTVFDNGEMTDSDCSRASGLRRRSSKGFVPRARYRELSDGPEEFGGRPVSRDGTGYVPNGHWTDEFPRAGGGDRDVRGNLLQPGYRQSLPNHAFEMFEDDFGVLRKPNSRSGFIGHPMETISENSIETESHTSPDLAVLPSPKRPATLSAKSSRVSSTRGRDPHSQESLRIFGNLSLEERSIAHAMNAYVSIASGELSSRTTTPRTTPVRHQDSLSSFGSGLDLNLSSTATMSTGREQRRDSPRNIQPIKTLLPLPDIDTSRPFSSFADITPLIDETVAEYTTDPDSAPRIQDFMLESQFELRSRKSQRSLRHVGETPLQIGFQFPDPRYRERLKSANGHAAAYFPFHLPLIPEARTDHEMDVFSASDSSPRRPKTSSSGRRKGRSKLSPLHPGFIDVGVPSLTDSGVQADEEDNNMDSDGTPRAVTLTHDDMMQMMETTPLLKAVYKWHVEERYFTEDLTAFACDPRTKKSVGYLPTAYREYFQRLHNPLVAFGYEVQRYCMRYIGGYDLSLQIQLLQKSQQDREHAQLFRDSGIGSDLGQNCGCESGHSCRRQGSSRDMDRRSPTPPPRLSIPFIEDPDEDDDLIGLGITNGPFFPPQPPSSPEEPDFLNLQKTDSAPSIRTLRKKGRLPSKETLREAIGSMKSEKAKGKCRVVYTPSLDSPPTPEVPPRSKRRRRVPDDCPRLPKLEIPELFDPSSGDISSTSRSRSRASAASSTAASQRTATIQSLSLPPLPKPVPLTPQQSDTMIRALYITMQALIVMRDFMSDLDDVHSIMRLPFGECSADHRAEARRRFYYDLLPQTLDRIEGTVSVLEEQAEIIGAILDDVPSPPALDSPEDSSSPPLDQPSNCNSHHSSQHQQPPETQFKPKPTTRGTPAWARATALEGTMTGCLPLPHSARRTASSLLLHSTTTYHPSPRRLLRPLSRICCACTRVRFRAIQQLVRFRFLDSFTYWNLERLENRLDKLRVDDGYEGAGAFCAMRYTVQGLAQQIIARRSKHIGIADTEERMSLDSEGWDRAGDCGGQEGWVRRVLGPRGRKNARWVQDGDGEEMRGLVSCEERGKGRGSLEEREKARGSSSGECRRRERNEEKEKDQREGREEKKVCY
ncbi:hypothetical protein B0T14DRAFT_565042 [Immersiella caudata]|uniref:Uncharacterized protein n=1 Tax=Immersiella caudata TaxID=314043 RepID=A0AA39WY06_9PEZI|nr:hypothetical protein B0T14DRAFT_565042 [Immersiella caudata]